MSNTPPWLQSLNIDPDTPLSTIDVARILLKYCDQRIQENNIEERNHTNEKMKLLSSALGSVARTVRDNADATETILADLSLKINTFSLYFEQLMNNLKSGLHHVFFQIGSDMRQVWSHIFTDNTSGQSSSETQESHPQADLLCHFCGFQPAEVEEFKTHIDAHHEPSTSRSGQLLFQHCPSPDIIITRDLSNHASNFHAAKNSQQSHSCEETFETTREHQIHTKTHHGQLLSQHCHLCDFAFETCDQLDNHFDIVHAPCLEPIPQYDGPLDELTASLTKPGPSSSSHTCRTAKYTFNQQKQTDKIKDDALIDDFDININNKDQNATVKCSSGFYLQVARAYLGYLEDKTVLSCESIAITVDKSVVTKDQLGIEATKQIAFTFMLNQKFLGGVSVHLHHSTRTIQIQGSAIMLDSSRAALWFLKKFILVKFKIKAKEKQFEIKNTNATLLNTSSNQPANKNIHPQQSYHGNICSYSNRGFNTQSKPSKCNSCENYFHKSSYLKDHMKV